MKRKTKILTTSLAVTAIGGAVVVAAVAQTCGSATSNSPTNVLSETLSNVANSFNNFTGNTASFNNNQTNFLQLLTAQLTTVTNIQISDINFIANSALSFFNSNNNGYSVIISGATTITIDQTVFNGNNISIDGFQFDQNSVLIVDNVTVQITGLDTNANIVESAITSLRNYSINDLSILNPASLDFLSLLENFTNQTNIQQIRISGGISVVQQINGLVDLTIGNSITASSENAMTVVFANTNNNGTVTQVPNVWINESQLQFTITSINVVGNRLSLTLPDTTITNFARSDSASLGLDSLYALRMLFGRLPDNNDENTVWMSILAGFIADDTATRTGSIIRDTQIANFDENGMVGGLFFINTTGTVITLPINTVSFFGNLSNGNALTAENTSGAITFDIVYNSEGTTIQSSVVRPGSFLPG